MRGNPTPEGKKAARVLWAILVLITIVLIAALASAHTSPPAVTAGGFY